MDRFYILVAVFFMGLLSALFGVKAAFSLKGEEAVKRPALGRLAITCVLSSLVIYPALFAALHFEYVVVAKRNPGAQAGVLALVIAMGCCALCSMLATLVLMARSRKTTAADQQKRPL